MYELFFKPGKKFIVLTSRTSGHAEMLLQTIKDKLDYSAQLRAVVGYWGEQSARVWTKRMVVLKDGTIILTRSTGMQFVGLKFGDLRPTLIIVDDPEDLANTKTAESMEFNLRWLIQAVLPAADAKRGRVVIIGTPQHQRSIVEVLSDMTGWITRRWKAIQDDGTALWPELLPIDELLKKKESAASIGRVNAFYREYQCTVTGDEEALFRAEHLREWDGDLNFDGRKRAYLTIRSIDGKALDTPEQVPVFTFMGVDPASSTKQTADYSTIVITATDKEKRRFVIDYFRKRVSPLTLAAAIIEYFHRFHPIRSRIESTGYQEFLREYVRSKVIIPGFEIKEMPRTSKSRRLEQMETIVSEKRLYLKKGMAELKDEMALYPRGTHDDLLDGLYYSLKRSFGPVATASVSHSTESEDQKPPDLDAWLYA
jgi:hypothetical protein